MRTTITVDDDLFDKAALAASSAGVTGDKNASSIITKALELLVASDSKKRILRLSGAMPDFTIPNRGGTDKEVNYREMIENSSTSMVAEDSPE
ncbi:MAG: hypothetical protein ACI9E1_002371 [Cryomorphaceae bacterium]|jgi:hypothetical protein